MLIDIIAGARPNFMKIAPIIHAIKIAQLEGFEVKFRLIHTGQHYDKKMSSDFFNELNIPEPDINLEAGGGTQAEQTGAIMIKYEKVLFDKKPDLLLVVGDVNSTMACAITAKKVNDIKVAHVEGGIRSWDLNMPEEINRLVTDSISDFFFTTSDFANSNLIRSGIDPNNIFFVGNTMIDTLLKNISLFKKPQIWDIADLQPNNYVVLTLHRPGNVDEEIKFAELLQAIISASGDLPIIFPVHPRTAKSLQNIGISSKKLHFIEPLSYLEFNYLVKNAKIVVTDSGGITEETTVLGIPCITLRNSTERPETCEIGTNELVGTDPSGIAVAFEKLFGGNWKNGSIPKFWDGNTSERIVSTIIDIFKINKLAKN